MLHLNLGWKSEAEARALGSWLVDRAGKYPGHEVHVPDGTLIPGSLDYGQGRRYWCLDGVQTAVELPRLYQWAAELPAFLAPLVGREVIGSPYVRSAIMPKVYRAGDWHGSHRDTNPLTALLYLDDVGVTSVDWPDQDPVHVKASPGALLVFNGRDLTHSVPPVDRPRAVVAFNMYYPDDVWRPANYDLLTFGLPGVVDA